MDVDWILVLVNDVNIKRQLKKKMQRFPPYQTKLCFFSPKCLLPLIPHMIQQTLDTPKDKRVAPPDRKCNNELYLLALCIKKGLGEFKFEHFSQNISYLFNEYPASPPVVAYLLSCISSDSRWRITHTSGGRRQQHDMSMCCPYRPRLKKCN